MERNKQHLKKSRLKKMSETEAAWLAGFFDGEGSITKSLTSNGHSKKRYVYWKVVIPNTSKLAMKKVLRITGIGVLSRRVREEKHYKPLWVWQLNAKLEIKDFASQVVPYMSIPEKIKNFNSVLV